MTCNINHGEPAIIGRVQCPRCGLWGWAASNADLYPEIAAQIRAQGGKGRAHVCGGGAIDSPRQPLSPETIQATYVKPRPIELEAVRQEIDWLALKGRSFAPGAALPRSEPDGSGQ